MILVVDPGDTTGMALFSETGELAERGQYNFDKFMEFISVHRDISLIIVEDYRLRAGKQAQQTGSRFQAVQVIGALKYYAYIRGAEFTLVDVQAKTLGAMYSGEKPPSNHKLSHQVDASNIGIYWFVKENIIEPPALKDL
jgi:hypothetical protein